MRLLGHILLGLLLGYAALAALLYVFQSRFIYFPEMGRGDRATPAQLQLPFEEVRIATADGETLHGWYVPAPGARATVLFLHGNAGSIVHRLDWLPMFQQLRPVGAAGRLPRLRPVERPALRGRHVRRRRGGLAPSDRGAAHPRRRASWCSASRSAAPSPRTSPPGCGRPRWCCTRPSPRRPTSRQTSIPFCRRACSAATPTTRWRRYEALRCPLLVAHSPQDEIVPVAHGRRLFAAAGEPKQWLELAGGHNDGFLFMRREWAAGFDRIPATPSACGSRLSGVVRLIKRKARRPS
jgi:hypothetical protein